MKRLYIVRHGETKWNTEEIFRGRKDIPLNEVGLKQAQLLADYFKDKNIDRIFSSPLLRARQTAHPLSTLRGNSVEIIEEFTDINFGIWEGLTLKEVEKNYPHDFAIWVNSPERLNVKDGETLEAVRKRIARGMERIISEGDENVVIVTHRVICKIMVLLLLNIGNEYFWTMKFDPASITLLEKANNRFILVYSNDTCHLRQLNKKYKDF